MTTCQLCPKYHPPIPGDGPTPCRYMVVGEAPAKREVEGQRRDHTGRGKVLVGDSGQEYMGLYLPLVPLDREQVYTTNVVKCANAQYSNPSYELATCCSQHHLHRELRDVQPEVIITMGAMALHTLFPGHDLEMEHGLPFQASWGAWEGTVAPMYHPAAGLRGGRYMLMLLQDWRELAPRLALYGGQNAPGRIVDPFPTPDYRECTTGASVRQYMEGCGGKPLAMDTEVESLRTMHPYCLSFSHTPGTARVIRASGYGALDELARYVRSMSAPIVMHNAVFDPPVLAGMGIGVQPGRFVDTMMMAYHLGDMPQSLKVLAYRLCGMRMREFEDVAKPHSLAKVMEWCGTVIAALSVPPCRLRTDEPADACMPMMGRAPCDMPKAQARKAYREYLEECLTPDVARLYRGMPIYAATPDDAYYLQTFVTAVNKAKTGTERTVGFANRLVSDIASKPDVDPWDRWAGWDNATTAPMIQAAGPMPELSIVHVPWAEALHYAARDADATIRLLPILRQRSVKVGRETI